MTLAENHKRKKKVENSNTKGKLFERSEETPLVVFLSQHSSFTIQGDCYRQTRFHS